MSQPDVTPIAHCVARIRRIVELGHEGRKSILQLGYNLGRLSELTGEGRTIWDDWKLAVEEWDVEQLRRLAAELDRVDSA